MEAIILLLTIVLYFLAPNNYDFFYCCILLILFGFSAYRAIKGSVVEHNYVNFTFFFTISFFFVNFFYPVFIFPFDKYYFLVFSRFKFNEDVITKATSLALVGYTSFVFGIKSILSQKRSKNYQRPYINEQVILNNSFKIYLIFSWAFTGIIFLIAKDGIVARSSDAFFNIEPSLLVINQCFINLLIICTFYLRKSFLNLSIVFIYIFIFIFVGDRGPAVQTSLVLLISYNIFYQKISRLKLFLSVLIGFVSLTIISSIRGKEGNTNNLSSVQYNNYYDFAMDLIVNNRNLYAGYDYVDKYGLNYGTSSLPYIFAPIPKLPSLITTTFFDSTPQELSTGTILTNDVNATWGLGTNLIIDIYMQFDIIGVISLMFGLGYFVTKLDLNVKNKLFSTICYIFIFSFSVYMTRSSLFDSVRYISWAAVIYFGIISLYKPFLMSKKQIK